MKNQWITRIQFPLLYASARTVHVLRGTTFQKVIIDMKRIQLPPKQWWEHTHYSALTNDNIKFKSWEDQSVTASN